jgi:hypothetical protein
MDAVVVTLLTGSPGHGKSYSLVKEIERTLAKGQPVGTNVPLAPDWPEVMAKRHVAFHWWRADAVARKADEYRRLVLVTDNLSDLLKIRLEGKGEGRGKLVLDEFARKVNARGWDNAVVKDPTTGKTKAMARPEAIAARQVILDHLSGHRHYGLDVLIATQDEKALDVHVRDLAEFKSEVRNMSKLPWLSLIIRFPLFVRTTRWNDRTRTKVGVSCYWLSKSLARLYQTHSLEAADWPEDAIILPRPLPVVTTTPTPGAAPWEPLSGQLTLDLIP